MEENNRMGRKELGKGGKKQWRGGFRFVFHELPSCQQITLESKAVQNCLQYGTG